MDKLKENRGLVHTYAFLFENEDFFLRFGLPPTRIWWQRSSQTLSRVKFFENTGFLSTCERTKTEFFEYDDALNHIKSTPDNLNPR